ncbi:MAG: tetratricopeptide repeat protein [Pyrinomonadaceae bacterium]
MLQNLFFGAIVLIFFVSSTVVGQIAGGMGETTATRLGGNNFIVGTVFWPSGQPVNRRMGLRLSSPTAGDYIITTDDRGQFLFSGLVAGNYSISIDGERDFDVVSQQVDVIQSRSPISQTYTVSIRLVDKRKPGFKPSVIDQASLAIPKRASEFFRKALDLSAAGDHKGAVEQLKRAIAEYSDYVNAYNELGVQYMQMNELEDADEALNAALKIKPDGFEPLVNRGITLFRLKRYPEADALLRGAIAAKDQSAIARYYLGRTLTSLEHYDEAEKELNLAIKLGGDEMREGHRMLANLFIAKGQDQRAIKEIEIYLRLVPDAPDAGNLRKAVRQLKAPRPAAPNPQPL